MDREKHAQALQNFVLPYLRKKYPDFMPLEESDEDILEATSTLLDDNNSKLDLSFEQISDFLVSLLQSESANINWQLGRHFINVWFKGTTLRTKTAGRLDERHDRIIIFLYVEWLHLFHGLSEEAAITKAAPLFKIPFSKLERWIIDKHDYATERSGVREFLRLYNLAVNGSDEEFAKIFGDLSDLE